ncbi:MAG: DNA-directed RNA polymerase subunit beta' [Verrucomicrobiota bacterium]|nr:DNA-directed RNA polymerase subunit beta' [Verrucomicrobiota bacterium]
MNQHAARGILGSSEPDKFNAIRVMLASPETIRSWSWGEVKNPETINYRTYKPERGGLFCERIFGPTKDWECSCGKYKRIKHKGVICDRCGVEVTMSRVRRERLGHIELAVPVSHIWFFKCTPSRFGLMMDMTAAGLERVLYYEDYLVTDPGDTPLKMKQLLSEMDYREAQEKHGDGFEARMGAEAIRDVMRKMDIDKLMEELDEEMEKTKNKQTRKKLSKRMKVVEGFRGSSARPEWMVLEVLPVIPPELRPLVPLEGGRFATSDLNDLYRRVINRNNRLKNLQQLKTPNVIIRNEKRMLQEAVDAVFDNGRHGRAVTGAGNRPLKSLSDMLRGKGGRFRQNLLGKRVDYSGRSVIVVGPDLKLNQCGVPKKMALVLFEPFIIRRLKERGVVHTVRSAKKLIEKQSDEVWDILDDVTRGKTVMLNRAPTLHRLSIQSFEPILIEGEAIQIHPLVCTAFNADFDGDQMAVHVPLSIEAQMESRLLMMSSNNIFSPSSGKSVMTPAQDIALGIYYLTSLSQRDRREQFKRAGRAEAGPEHLSLFNDANEVRLAYDDGAIGLHTRIRFRNPDYRQKTVCGDAEKRVLETTVGRVFFNEIWPIGIGFVNHLVNKGMIGDLIWHCHRLAPHGKLVEILDTLKALGFTYATLAGISIGLVDMIIPAAKDKITEETREAVEEVHEQYKQGVITDGERHNKVVDIWTQATEEITTAMYRAIEENAGSTECNPVYMMVDSKSRGSRQQIRQLAGMRGLMAKPSGEIIERPITANFREGLSVLEYFISTHGARKGLADTALKTADAGYLTRKLVDVAQDVIIVEQDCNTLNGIEVQAMSSGDEELIGLRARILGRNTINDVADSVTGEIILRASDEVTEEACEKIVRVDIGRMRIRSVLTCESRRGLCAKCYGRDLATGRPVDIGTAVGIIAAQSIGEPGTQLTLRTFHIGGTASAVFKQPEVIAKNSGVVRYLDLRVVVNQEGRHVVLNKSGVISIHDDSGHELERYATSIGAQVFVENGGTIKKAELLAKWDPYSVPILAEQQGIVSFHDFVDNVSVKKEVDDATGKSGVVILESKKDLHPQIVIKAANKEEILGFYSIPAGAHAMVEEGQRVYPGDLLARTPRKESKTRDIVGGLPRVAELFEARQPKDAAEIARIEGLVDFGANQRGRRCLIIRDEVTGDTEEHLIPMGKHIVVFKGDRVRKGQQLTEGPIIPQEVLEVCGPQELQEYLVNEVQQVYRLQGVEINDKHIEIIIRQMLRKVKITNPGDTEFLWGEQVDKQKFLEANESAVAEGKRPAEATPALLGITKASLSTESFISAASFQDTTRVLTEAATLGRIDYLRGFKENVIMGHLIPGGTGFAMGRAVKLVPLSEPIEEEAPPPAGGEDAGKKLQELLA